MFYSETLLSKTGPLARVWLAANLERRVTKTHVLQSNIETSVNAIVDQGQAPLALRLSGQLLLGVVRIYSKKARYLLDDCNEALIKIKMAFRPGNVDLPTNQSHTANPASLTLPDALTELDLLGPVGDPSLLLSENFDGILDGRDPTLLDMGSSQRIPSSIERARAGSAEIPRLEDDLGLDLNFGDDLVTPSGRERDVEIGRDAPGSKTRPDEPSQLFDDDLDLNLGDSLMDQDETTLKIGRSNIDNDVDMHMGGMDDDLALNILGDDRDATPRLQNGATDGSPFKGGDESTFMPNLEDESVHLPQRAKKRKILQADADTEIHSSQIKAQLTDRSKILKPTSYLPRDPTLLALLNMQKTGEFISNLLGDGRSRGWAPELRGILSLEVIRKSGDLKRKRDSGVSGVQDARGGAARLEEDDPDGEEREELEEADGDLNESRVRFEDDEGGQGLDLEDENFGMSEPADNFEDTTMPLLHPKDSGAISLGTKHAVHLLREKFGPDAADSPAKRQKSSILFQDLLPEEKTTRADATKMFFEVLALATKDAIKVEQKEDVLGGDLRIRGKRGLWGAWAETEADGEIASQEALVAA